MPGFDQTGPQGQGAKTGRGFGPCGGGVAFGRGRGRGMGCGFGFGRGFGLGSRRATKADDITDIKNYIEDLEAELKDAKNYLKDLAGQK